MAQYKLGVVSAVFLAGAATLLVIQNQSTLRLQRVNRALKHEASQLTALAAENERLSNVLAQANSAQANPKEQAHELLRLRGEATRLRQQNHELDKLREENRQLQAVLVAKENSPGAIQAGPPDYWPKGSWAFVGYATPEDSLQSGLWAASGGDLKVFLASITGEMETLVRQDLDGKSESEARARLTNEVAKIRSCRIVNREILSGEEVVLTLSIEDGDQPATMSKLAMKQVANEWKLAGKRD